MKLLEPLSADAGWKEAHGPALVKWENPGETIAGVLTSVMQVDVKGKRVTQYTLTIGDNRLQFLGTFDLMQKITRAHVGCQVRIKYLGEDDSVRGGPNNKAMKVFSVQLKGTPSNGAQSGPITDEDIPF